LTARDRLAMLWVSGEDDEADVLESAIDLFSLLSFVLLSAAVSFASTGAPTTTHSAVLSFGQVERNNATLAVPQGASVLVVVGRDPVQILNRQGSGETTTIWSSGNESIADALNSALALLSKAEFVALTIRDANADDALPRLRAFYQLQVWLSDHEIDATVFLE